MAQPRIVISSQTMKDAEALAAMIARLPDRASKRMAKAMAGAAAAFIKDFRASMPSKFKVQKTKAGNAFKWYITGRDLGSLEAHLFTNWRLAKLYERGGVIKGNGAMAVPVNPKAYTSQGRIKKRWHDPKNFKNLVPIETKGGRILLVREKKSIKSADGSRITSRTAYGKGSKAPVAVEPMFVLITQTTRKPTLRFYQDFASKQSEILRRMDRAAYTTIERDTTIGGANAG
jgi:hypothetical protein